MALDTCIDDVRSTIDPDVLEFIDSVPDYLHLKCPVCLGLLLPDAPRLFTCCGNHFCQTCVFEIYSRSPKQTLTPCPICSESIFQYVPDKNHQRALKSLKVLCTKKQSGCEWVGELGSLIVHLSREGDCKHVVFDCVNKCGAQLCRSEIYKHEVQCLKKSTYVRIVTRSMPIVMISGAQFLAASPVVSPVTVSPVQVVALVQLSTFIS